MKRLVLLLCVFILLLASVFPSAAAINAVQITKNLQYSGTTAYCDASVSQIGSEITLSAELWRGNTQVAYWDDIATGNAAISGSCSVQSGATYTLKFFATVDGESIYIAPITKRCP